MIATESPHFFFWIGPTPPVFFLVRMRVFLVTAMSWTLSFFALLSAAASSEP